MHAARLMTLHAAWKMDQVGASASRDEIAMIKYYGAAVLHNVIDRAIQTHGALGYSSDLPLERCTAGARRAYLRRTRRGPPPDRGASRVEELHAEKSRVSSFPFDAAAAREKFAGMLEFLEAEKV
jgi:acyl-CoA dehydrogenase